MRHSKTRNVWVDFVNSCKHSIALTTVAAAIALNAVILPVSSQESAVLRGNWAQWRGPDGSGSREDAKPPIRWSETENIRWKTELPGLGHSTPVVWGDRVFVTTAVPVGEPFDPIPDSAPGSHDNLDVSHKFAFVLLAFDRKNGKKLWQKQLHQTIPHEGGHVSASLASASPVTDGNLVVASFGSHGIYCVDFEGNLIWQKSLGRMNSKHGHGEGASPTLFESTLIINWDHEGQSFLVALDFATGKEIWRQPRNEVTSWSSPIVYKHDGVAQVIVAGTGAVRGYDLESGDVIWSCRGLSNNICATPIAKDGMVYVGSSYEIRSMLAINLDGARGDITGTSNVAWKKANRTPYVPSMLHYRGNLYYLRHYQPILTIVDAITGEESIGPFRINGLRNIYASPVAADGKIYFTDREGVTVVVSEPDLPRVLSVNQLEDSFSASLAIVDNEIFLRGEKFLYCVAEKKPIDPAR